MNSQNSTENIFSKAAPAAAALAITASFIFLPLAGTVAVLFLPASIAYARHRYGLSNSGLAAFFSSAFAFSVSGSAAIASIIMLFCVSGYIMGISTAAEEPADRVILKASIYPLLIALPAAAAFFSFNGIDPWALLEKGLNLSLQESIKIYQQMGMSQADIDALKPSLQLVVRVVTDYFPALVVWLMVGSASVSLSALRAYLAKKGLPGGVCTVITAWYPPDHAVWGIIIPGFLMIPDYQPLRLAAGNLLASVAIIYLFQGFAVVIHLFDRIKLTRFLRALTLVLILLQPFLILFMWALGFFDTWADFRKIRPGAKTKV